MIACRCASRFQIFCSGLLHPWRNFLPTNTILNYIICLVLDFIRAVKRGSIYLSWIDSGPLVAQFQNRSSSRNMKSRSNSEQDFKTQDIFHVVLENKAFLLPHFDTHKQFTASIFNILVWLDG